MTADHPLRVERTATHVRLILNRPNVRNAFNGEFIEALTIAAHALAGDASTRTIVLEGAGNHFCAGADLQWMQASSTLSEAENIVEARRLAQMFAALNALPQMVIGRIQGAALGGGAGLSAICDTVIAAADASFGFTEVRLGLIPAVISPFVIAKIGLSQARRYFVNGQRFNALTAQSIGLVHQVVPAYELDSAVAHEVEQARHCAPQAIAAAKRLLASFAPRSHKPIPPDAADINADTNADANANVDANIEITAQAIARRRVSAEGQAGVKAFLERQAPPWTMI